MSPFPLPALTAFDGLLWRAVPVGSDPRAVVPAQTGLFHHHGQHAFYGATSPEGALRLAQNGAAPGDGPRELVSYALTLARVADLRAAALDLDWQGRAASGAPVPSHALADAARAAGAEALIWHAGTVDQLVLFCPPAALIEASPRRRPDRGSGRA